MKTIDERIESLNEAGYAVCEECSVFPACWLGVSQGHLWFHLGDKPHWAGLYSDLRLHGRGGVLSKTPHHEYYFSPFGETPDLPTCDTIDHITEMRKIMTRKFALELLGDP